MTRKDDMNENKTPWGCWDFTAGLFAAFAALAAALLLACGGLGW